MTGEGRRTPPGGPSPLPYRTRDVPPVPARMKARPEDFFVEEIPAYAASGTGGHTFVVVEKRGITTHRLVRDLAARLGVPPGTIGRAGLKDARAVTRQTLSVEGVDPERVLAVELDRARVLSAARHDRKIRVGHLRGNRFRIRLREVPPERSDDLRTVLHTLARGGVPNFFGSQRFGARGDSWEVGRALLRRDDETALSVLLGRPAPWERPDVRDARARFDAGAYGEAAALWPRDSAHCGALCRALARGRSPRQTVKSLDRKLQRFFVSAYQSHLFNAVLAERLDSMDSVLDGDLALKHANGAVFLVEDAGSEAPRAEAFEISATGPLFGPRMREPRGRPAALEAEVLRREGGRAEDFSGSGLARRLGGRRPLRAPVTAPSVDDGNDAWGPFVEVAFELPPGVYATAVIGEMCKSGLNRGGGGEPGDAGEGDDEEGAEEDG